MSYGVGLRNGIAFALGTIPSLTSGGGLRPSLLLNFLSGTLDSRITFSRGTQATQYTSNGTLQYAPNNLLTYSNQADNAAWTKSNSFLQTNLLLQSQTLATTWIANNVSVNSNVAVAPDGTLTADEIVCTANALAYLGQSLGAFSTYSSTLSVYLKVSGTDRGAILNFQDDTGGVDIYSLTIPSLASGGTDVGNGWRRYSVTGLTPTPGNVASVRIYVDKNGTGVSGVSRLYAWGAQLVQGSVPGDYRATTSAALPVLYADYQGNLRAKKLCETAIAASTHLISQGITTTATPYTFSVYAKQPSDGAARRYFLVYHSQSNAGWVFDLQTGTLGVGGTTGVSAPVAYAITSVGNGWYRCQITVNATAASNSFLHYLVDNNGSSGSAYTGDGSSGIYIADAQLEAGSTVQAYNDTTSAAYYGPRFDYDPTNYVRQNLLTYSEQFDNAIWIKGSAGAGVLPIVEANKGVAPDGTLTADRIDFNCGALTITDRSYIQQTVVVPLGVAYTDLIWIKAFDSATVGKSIRFVIENGGVSGTNVFTITDQWQRIVVSGAGTVFTSVSVLMETRGTYTASTTASVLVWGAQLNTGSTALTYTATTTAPYTLVAARGLLIEEQRANLLLQSNDFQTSWTPTNITRGLISTTGPDGTLSGVKIEATAAAATILYQLVTSTATAHTFSVQVKQGTGATTANSFILRNNTTATNLVGGTLNYGTGVFTYTVGSTGVVVTNIGNGWWRIAITATAGITVGDGLLCYVGFSGGVQAAGDFLYAYGAQLETGAFATSYIPTVASQVTRSTDSASVNTLTPWFNAAAGTIYAEGVTNAPVDTNVRNIVSINDGTTTNVHRIFSYNGKIGGSTVASSVNSSDLQPFTYTSGAIFKSAYAFAVNDFAMSVNGVSPLTDTLGALPAGLTTLSVGGPSIFWGFWIRSINYYPNRLPNATLQGLTV